ncbi:S8 family serine peptidase [Polaromonas sp. CT11-55]|uniref:S8 family serine peptidase n=1 Tax=Polaromonas sp. CT11-55 TaxID=3243045 RepID=UPI0039A49FF3
MGLNARDRMNACWFFPLACIALAALPAKAATDEEPDCKRYRIAGLPCPAKPGGARPATRPLLPPRAVEPAPAAGRSLAAPAPGVPSPPPSPLFPLAAPTAPTAPATPGLPALPAGSALLPMAIAPLAAPGPPVQTREPGQVVVYWAAVDEADAALERLARERRVLPITRSRLEALGGVLAVFQLESAAQAADFRAQLLRDFPGLAADFNTRYRPLQQNQARPRIYLPQKIDQVSTGVEPASQGTTRVGMVDGPVAAIAALAGARISRKSFLAAGETAAPVGHGTSVAALIAGQDAGVAGFRAMAPGASLHSAEIMRSVGADDCSNSAALVRALDWLLAENVQLINLSLGGPGDAVMEKAFARLAEFPVALVAAAGNGGPAAPPAYPAAYPGVIAVTATDASDNVYAAANRGAYITLAAPGVDLWVPDGAFGHYVSGTSFSAAVVSAAGALLLGRNPLLKPRSLARQLCRGARDLGAPGPDPVFGCGLIQVGASLRDERL